MEKDTVELNNELSEAEDIEEFIEDNLESFQKYTLAEYLGVLMKEKGQKKSEIIAKSHLEQIYAYHIFAGRKKNPSRNKILALALAMNLTQKETGRLLYYAGSEVLYPKNAWDSVIIYALNNKMSVEDTNTLLLKLSQAPLMQNV